MVQVHTDQHESLRILTAHMNIKLEELGEKGAKIIDVRISEEEVTFNDFSEINHRAYLGVILYDISEDNANIS